MIIIKTKQEISAMREGGKILAEIMEKVSREIAPGKNTTEIDKLAEKLVFASGGTPAFKGYTSSGEKPFPATICASLNNEVVHGVPSDKVILKNGDLFKIDIGMKYKGIHTDMARTFAVGEISSQAKKLKEVTEQCFWKGIENFKEGTKLSDYSKAVQKCAEDSGFSVVRNLVGHGVGKELHEDPIIPNYYNRKYEDVSLISGMTFALEPMINAGNYETVLSGDGWVFKTRDGSLSAHYENTVLITKKGVEVLTIL